MSEHQGTITRGTKYGSLNVSDESTARSPAGIGFTNQIDDFPPEKARYQSEVQSNCMR